MNEYDLLADWYNENRDPEIGVQVVADFVADLPAGASILDLGCGNGVPITRYLHEQGFDCYGIDSSAKMVAKFKTNLPDVPVECADLFESDWFDRQFDAIIAYGVMFHFPPDEQKALIAKVSEHLVEGGRFLFNSGNESGETTSVMDGVEVKHWSMSEVEYYETLKTNILTLIKTYHDNESGALIYLGQLR